MYRQKDGTIYECRCLLGEVKKVLGRTLVENEVGALR